MKETDNWKTPEWLMRLFDSDCWIDRTPIDYTKDCLISEWNDDRRYNYLNPPYSNPLPFILKGIEQHKKHGITVAFLLKLDTSTKWYRELVSADAHFIYVGERLHYSDKDSAPFPSTIAILSE